MTELPHARGRVRVVFDGDCGFCRRSVRRLRRTDRQGVLEYINYRECPDIKAVHPGLTFGDAHRQVHIIDYDGKLYGGFFGLRRLCQILPGLKPLRIFLSLPGMTWLGQRLYRWVAGHRQLFFREHRCKDSDCIS